MNYLIDTNVISEVRKGPRCNAHVANWFEVIDDASIYVSVPVLGEIRRGIERSRSRNPTKARALESWLIAVTTSFASPGSYPLIMPWLTNGVA